MKAIKMKMIWFVAIAVAGVILFTVNIIGEGNNTYISGFASGLIVVAVVKLVQLIKTAKNPELLKNFEMMQKEERFISIAEKSSRITMLATYFAEFAAICILIFVKQTGLAMLISYAVCIQILIYLCIYSYYSKKY